MSSKFFPTAEGPSASRIQRWSLVLIGLLMGGGLLLSALSFHSETSRLQKRLLEGEALHLRDAFHLFLRLSPEPPRLEEYQDFFRESQEDGLTYLAILDGTGQVLLEIGSAMGKVELRPFLPGETALRPFGEHFQMLHRLPTQLDSQLRLPRGTSSERSVPLMPIIDFEFEPLQAQMLRYETRKAMFFMALGALSFAVGILFLLFLLHQRTALVRELAQKRHLATLGEMAATLAHELRNPLASAKGHAQLLAEALGK